MEKKSTKNRFKIAKIILAILMCFFCSVSFMGCVGRGGAGPGGGSSSSGSGSGSSDSDTSDDDKEENPSVDDMNDVLMGAIAVYEIGIDEKVFWDKYKTTNNSELVSFKDIVDRQFETLASYIYNTLNRAYGENRPEASSFTIGGYGAERSINLTDIISNRDQQALTGISGSITNQSNLNYSNAINGGYRLEGKDTNDDGTIDKYEYGTATTGNTWIGKSYFDKETLKKYLIGIYYNPCEVTSPDSPIKFNSDNKLANHYGTSFTFSDLGSSSYENIRESLTQVGMTREYLWNIAYFLGHSLIGSNNLNLSMNANNIVFSGPGSVNVITSENYQHFENYKGYDVIIEDMINNLATMFIPQNSSNTIEFDKSTGSKVTWETTLFPSVNRCNYLYVDDVNLISDANNEDMFALEDEEGTEEDEEDYEDFEEDEEWVEEPIEPGTSGRLKQIILLPHINSDKFKGEYFKVTGLLLGFQSKNGDTLKVEMSTYAIFNDGSKLTEDESSLSATMEGGDNVVNNQLTFAGEFLLSEGLIDVTLPLDGQFVNIKNSEGADAKTLIEESFNMTKKEVSYPSGTSVEIGIGNIKVYNQLITQEGELNLSNNLIELNFKYFNSSGGELSDVPETYLMYFYLYA